MKRTTKLIVAAVAIGAVITGVAVAASSPTVVTEAATKISNSGARLNASVNPNGNQTGYSFQYGLTTAYGLTTKGRSAGHGTKPLSVGVGVGGLTPGTVYHYRIVALNHAGTSFGTDRKFKTTGAPPPGVTTGPAVNVGKTTATVTGTVDTNGAATQWLVQYGLTTSYGQETFSQVIPKSPTPTAVSVQLTGLTSATLFHYRLIGLHGSKVVSDGNDATFFTKPVNRLKPRLSTRTTPRLDRRAPFSMTTGGTLHGATSIPASVRCTGTTSLSYFNGKRRMLSVLVPVGPNCKFSVHALFRHIRGHKPRQVRIAIHFRGNGYIAPVSRNNRVTVG
jgi:hypothetical protein